MSGYEIVNVPIDEVLGYTSGDFPGRRMSEAYDAMLYQWETAPFFAHDSEIEAGGPAAYVEQLTGSMRVRGYDGPPVFATDYAWSDAPVLTDGHHRAIAAARAGLAEIPVRRHKKEPTRS